MLARVRAAATSSWRKQHLPGLTELESEKEPARTALSDCSLLPIALSPALPLPLKLPHFLAFFFSKEACSWVLGTPLSDRSPWDKATDKTHKSLHFREQMQDC